jgi:hypothetical protein
MFNGDKSYIACDLFLIAGEFGDDENPAGSWAFPTNLRKSWFAQIRVLIVQ